MFAASRALHLSPYLLNKGGKRMKRGKTSGRLSQQIGTYLFLVVAILIGTQSDADAYIDPGYGSLLWQLAVAGVVGVAFYYRNFLARLRTWFKTILNGENKNG
jgi:hypothetical protein